MSGFQQGLSGVNGAAQQLDVIGNNVANASTVGYKSSAAQFADMYANSVNLSANSGVGIGVANANVAQSFTQGSLTSTSNPLDIAINGNGFFRMVASTTDQTPLYARNGQFQLTKDGYINNPTEKGALLTGWAQGVTGGDPTPLQINTANIPATQTTKVTTSLNLDSRNSTPTTSPFSATDPTSYNSTTGVTLYDSLGNTYNAQTYYVKNPASNGTTTWDVYTTVDGTAYPAAGTAAETTYNANNLNLSSSAAVITPASPFLGTTAGTDYNNVHQTVVYDSTGTATTLNTFFVKTSATTWKVYGSTGTTLPGTILNAGAALGTLTFDSTGALTSSTVANPQLGGSFSTNGIAMDFTGSKLSTGAFSDTVTQNGVATGGTAQARTGQLTFNSSGLMTSSSMANLQLTPRAGASFAPAGIALNYTGTTQTGAAFATVAQAQDGTAPGVLSGFNIGQDGVITGSYSNSQTKALGTVLLVNFANPNGLQSRGNNLYGATAAAGVPLIGQPTAGGLGALQSKQTESSNIDLTSELVGLIVAQRVYQANAQSIKAQDTVLQSVIQIA
ncbi:flagellar hook-basal body complex protein [Herbaspirillum sp. RTI4]|uniref:flagellar hook-basal body complex protein n=1 Tax=Herbaspirillum sp. RTI4 TaxID=3048640 RepID=UPI002AB53EEE|nr:flagellar hook-basal body complex protein [Herbaspirillum sp. RTI4]MDY7578299.1 flagellar hook-basal body complex protein [Herbaspirillum sp. RTI4]MEA9981208.1 flagellar hook-basal body complex protein [Herbaspirillum sp. RTI4]